MNVPPDLAQWLGFTEESFLLQDGLLRLGDLVAAPPGALVLCDQEARTQHIISLASEDTDQLCVKLEQLCRSENSGFRNLQKYRLSALKGLWQAKKNLEKWKEDNSKGVEEAGIVAVRQRKGGNNESSSNNFSSKLSLLLLFPLIKSQASKDPSLCQVTTKLLLESLRECPPLSLKEPAECLDGLEDLLSSWLLEDQDDGVRNPEMMGQSSLETAAAALVTLACARNSTKTLIHTIYLLKQLESLENLPVHDIISIFGALEGGSNVPATLNSSKHVNCWSYDDQLSNAPISQGEPAGDFAKRSITTDGSFFYITDHIGCGLSKMGTGMNGTMRGFIYTTNTSFETGFVAFASDVLLHRPFSLDNLESSNKLGVIVDPNTLQARNTINLIPELLIDCHGQVSTLSLTSNGMEFYWVRSVSTSSENCPLSSQVSNLIILDVFCIESNDIKMCSTRKILSKKEEGHEKSVSFENIIRPKRSSSTTGLDSAASSSGGQNQQQQNNKDENTTSVGIPLKTLKLCPIITCGNFITIMSPPTPSSSPASHLARTLFSGGSNSTKSSAVCNTFSTKDGFFNSKSDLLDAANSSFSKGALLTSMCATFDTFNNSIWIASMDHIDQFHNTGHQAASYNFRKLGISRNARIMTSREGNMASVKEVTSTLIEHTGLVALYLMANNQSNSAMAGKKTADMTHFEMLISLLEDSVLKNDEKSTLCLMVQAQYVINYSQFDKISENDKKLISRLKTTLWKLIKMNINEKITLETCETFIKALTIFYPALASRTDLLMSLFNEESENIGVLQLREMLLCHFSLILNDSNNADLKQFLWRAFELNQMVIKHTVQTTKMLINNLMEDEETTELLCITPKSSGSLQYVSALMKSLLTKCLLEKVDDDEEIQIIIDLTEELFDCCMDLLEFLKEKLELITNLEGDRKVSNGRVNAIEEILKSSVLSQGLLPTATSMTEPPFLSLDICQNFISKLVQMSNISCGISNSILSIGKQNEENEDNNCSLIFSTLKIPEPWKAGKIVESTHPLKDNYKFKETIKIPGAKCLYLNFDKRCSTQYDYDKIVLHAGKFYC